MTIRMDDKDKCHGGYGDNDVYWSTDNTAENVEESLKNDWLSTVKNPGNFL